LTGLEGYAAGACALAGDESASAIVSAAMTVQNPVRIIYD
jgi:hypothetical protein